MAASSSKCAITIPEKERTWATVSRNAKQESFNLKVAVSFKALRLLANAATHHKVLLCGSICAMSCSVNEKFADVAVFDAFGAVGLFSGNR
jgi:hypothetical protein